MIDKAFEACFGFIHVLPGAFSGYRWEALKDDSNSKEKSVLDMYLEQVLDKDYQFESLDVANMFLAEDRILNLSIWNRRDK